MMKSTNKRREQGWRYSPLPRDEYPYPASSSLFGPQEAWNLAYLSHRFDQPKPPSHKFSTAVRATLQLILPEARLDPFEYTTDTNSIYCLMRKPPAQAVERILRCTHLHEMPLYTLMGSDWPRVMQARVSLCVNEDPATALDRSIDVDPASCNTAQTLLRKFMLGS